MRSSRLLVMVAGVLVLAGCSKSQQGAENSATTYEPSTGTFAAVTAPAAAGANTTHNCNVDSINGGIPGTKPLSKGSTALFTGWAVAGDGSAVPDKVEIVLDGTSSFAVQASTGASRPDVAKSMDKTALVKSGYAIKAGMADVPTGTYKVLLRYQAGGKAWTCPTAHPVTVG